jgi:hypothetical protein
MNNIYYKFNNKILLLYKNCKTIKDSRILDDYYYNNNSFILHFKNYYTNKNNISIVREINKKLFGIKLEINEI